MSSNYRFIYDWLFYEDVDNRKLSEINRDFVELYYTPWIRKDFIYLRLKLPKDKSGKWYRIFDGNGLYSFSGDFISQKMSDRYEKLAKILERNSNAINNSVLKNELQAHLQVYEAEDNNPIWDYPIYKRTYHSATRYGTELKRLERNDVDYD